MGPVSREVGEVQPVTIGVRPSGIARLILASAALSFLSGCVHTPLPLLDTDPQAALALVALVGVGLVLFAVFWALAARRWRPRQEAKRVLAVLAGAGCGGVWALMMTMVMGPATAPGWTVLVVGAVPAIGAAILLPKTGPFQAVLGRAVMLIGLHGLAVPIAALIALLVHGTPTAQAWGEELSLRSLLRAVTAAGPSLGGLLGGVVLVAIADRLLRQARPRGPSRTERTPPARPMAERADRRRRL